MSSLHECDKLGDLWDRQDEEDVRVDGGDVPQEDDLRPLEVLVGEGEHLVEGVEQHLDLWSDRQSHYDTSWDILGKKCPDIWTKSPLMPDTGLGKK